MIKIYIRVEGGLNVILSYYRHNSKEDYYNDVDFYE